MAEVSAMNRRLADIQPEGLSAIKMMKDFVTTALEQSGIRIGLMHGGAQSSIDVRQGRETVSKGWQ